MTLSGGLPRMRGSTFPLIVVLITPSGSGLPHARRSTRADAIHHVIAHLLTLHARRQDRPPEQVPKKQNDCLLRMRGRIDHSCKNKKKQNIVYPACAGIDPAKKEMFPEEDFSLPRMRGDRPPPLFLLTRATDAYFPHACGIDPVKPTASQASFRLLPACADDDLSRALEAMQPPGVYCPHARGSTPLFSYLTSHTFRLPRARGSTEGDAGRSFLHFPFTPHAWGSTGVRTSPAQLASVYPACAGSTPVHGLLRRSLLFTPHARDRPAEKTCTLL